MAAKPRALAPEALRQAADGLLRARQAADGEPRPCVARLRGASVRADEGLCRRVADWYEQAPAAGHGTALHRRYRTMARHNLRLYREIARLGIEIEPWPGPGQPYQDSAHLISEVHRTARLRVYLTAAGHGPGRSTDGHPLRADSGLTAGGTRLCHNDVFRAVHDVFGHVLLGTGFGPRGEFLAAYGQMQLYPAEVRPVLLAEQVGQICWFYYGRHLRAADGTLPRRGEPGYLPPPLRPYPEQKACAVPAALSRAYLTLIRLDEEAR